MALHSLSPGWRGLCAVVLMAGVGLAAMVGIRHFSTEARLTRATQRLIHITEKEGPESAVSLARAADNFGKFLATNAVLTASEFGALATGRQEMVSLFAQTRSSLNSIAFPDPRLQLKRLAPGEVRVEVRARFRFDVPGEGMMQDSGVADLLWRKTSDGWRLVNAELSLQESDLPAAAFP